MKKIFILLFLLTPFVFSQVEVSTRLQRALQNSKSNEFVKGIIYLKQQVDIEALDAQLYRENASLQKRAYTVITRLQEMADRTQGTLKAFLEQKKAERKIFSYQSFWIANMFQIEALPEVFQELTASMEVAQMDLDALLQFDRPVAAQHNVKGIEGVEPGVKIINADKLWRLGFTGQGRIVMNIDTGVEKNHPALNYKWRGTHVPASQAWFDPAGTTVPTDCDGHGTHTTGTMCGLSPTTGDTVGVAIGAEWIAAKTICSSPHTTNSVAAFQWATNPDGNPNTADDMPAAISCSWYDPDVTNECSGIYLTTLNAVEAAGIGVVFSAGNNGPSASTITKPKNINADEVNVFCTAAIDGAVYLGGSTNPITSFSSRGPSACGGTGSLLIKPEVSAPGNNVRSSYPPTGYSSLSGTSMASPHVAGAITVLRSAAPGMTGKQIKKALYESTKDLGTAGEDNTYGTGLIDMYAAYLKLATYPLNPFNLTAPQAGTIFSTFPNSSTQYTFAWDTSSMTATYKWIFGTPANPNRIVVPVTTNQFAVSSGMLDNLLEAAGVAQGDSVVGQWNVWAYRNNPPQFDSLISVNGPRALTLKRGIPQYSPFSLVAPASGTTLVTSSNNTTPVTISWTNAGQGIRYKWKFRSPNFSGQTYFDIPSGNGGYDTSITVGKNVLDGMLSSIGLATGDSIVGQWKVFAFRNPQDSLGSTNTFDITLKRQALGDYLVVYDSSAANCRISKDSVLANLNLMGASYDLKNRGTGSTGTGFSMRGYKKVIWLGEGTSVLSVAQKDSIKGYLASGGTTNATKAKFMLFAEDVGYSLDRTGATYYDSAFARQQLGFIYVLDRPSTGGAQGLINLYTNVVDSTIGTWPDVLRPSASASNVYKLYGFRLYRAGADSVNAIGHIGQTYNTAVYGVDIESVRPGAGTPAGSPVARILQQALDFVNGTLANPVPTVTVTAPNGGENWSIGMTKNVTWTSSNVGNVKIQYSTNNGTDWLPVAASVPAGNGTYAWTVPNTPTTQAKVRISDASADTIFDVSNAVFTITTQQILTVPMSMAAGWNMASVPVAATDMTAAALFAGANSSVFAYNNGYVTVTTLANGAGYWVRYASAANFNHVGTPAQATSIPLVAGWNMIGPHHQNIPVANVVTTPPGIINSSFFGFENGYVQATSLNSGKGYWVRATAAGGINVPTEAVAGKEGDIAVVEFNKDWGKLIFSSPTGEATTLYTTKKLDNAAQYELPPVPPAGVFDARFENNSAVTALGTEAQTITFQSALYPVTITAQGVDVVLRDKATGGKAFSQTLREGESVQISNSGIGAIEVTQFAKPLTYELSQNYPNPFNPSTTIRFGLPEKANLTLTVYNQLGEKVAQLINGEYESGYHSVEWNASNMPSGIYFYELRTESFSSIKKLMLMK